MIVRLAGIGAVVALALAALVYPVAAVLVSGATEAWLITPHGDTTITKWQFGEDHPDWDPAGADASDPATVRNVAEVYGNLVGDAPMQVLFVDDAQLLHPEELPQLVLLPQDKQAGENVLQAATVWFFARHATLGSSMAGLALLGLWAFLRRRRSRSGAPKEPEPHPV